MSVFYPLLFAAFSTVFLKVKKKKSLKRMFNLEINASFQSCFTLK